MARGVNKVILIGNLGRDPEVRYTAGGSAVANVTIATSEAWKDKQSGEANEKTEWHQVVFFGNLAEIAQKYLAKGSKVYIEGRLQTRKWQDKNGQDRYTTEIIAGDMQMLDSRGGDDAGGHQRQGGGSQQSAPPRQPTGRPSSSPTHSGTTQGTAHHRDLPHVAGVNGNDMDDFDDDIPF